MAEYHDTRDRVHEITAGRYTLVPDDLVCGVELHLGSFCSIASGVRVVSGQHPPIEYPQVVPTFPFLEHGWGDYPPCKHSGRVIVGNDVWIGEGVTLLDGVRIGHGSIIGAHAVVAKDVPDYAVVVGNPGKVRKLRFDPETIKCLLGIAWWNWSDDKIREELPRLANVMEFAQMHSDLDSIALEAYRLLANQRAVELDWLIRKLDGRSLIRVLEIGSQDGGTLFVWSRVAPNAKILSVDWEGNVRDGPWEVINADSHDPATVQQVRDRFAGPVDFLFIDGDHSYEGVKADWENYSPLVAEGGLIAFHDIDGQCKDFWEAEMRSDRTEEFVDPNEGTMGIGIVYL